MKPRRQGTIYLLHFDTRYKHAGHYLGFTSGPVEERIREHQSGTGSRLMAVVVEAGISFRLATTWRGGRTLERRKKNQGGASRLCPICREEGRRSRRNAYHPPTAGVHHLITNSNPTTQELA